MVSRRSYTADKGACFLTIVYASCKKLSILSIFSSLFSTGWLPFSLRQTLKSGVMSVIFRVFLDVESDVPPCLPVRLVIFDLPVPIQK